MLTGTTHVHSPRCCPLARQGEYPASCPRGYPGQATVGRYVMRYNHTHKYMDNLSLRSNKPNTKCNICTLTKLNVITQHPKTFRKAYQYTYRQRLQILRGAYTLAIGRLAERTTHICMLRRIRLRKLYKLSVNGVVGTGRKHNTESPVSVISTKHQSCGARL